VGNIEFAFDLIALLVAAWYAETILFEVCRSRRRQN